MSAWPVGDEVAAMGIAQAGRYSRTLLWLQYISKIQRQFKAHLLCSTFPICLLLDIRGRLIQIRFL